MDIALIHSARPQLATSVRGGRQDVRYLCAGRSGRTRDMVPTAAEGVELLSTMAAYAGAFSWGENVVVHHIDTLEPGIDRHRSNLALRARGRFADDYNRSVQELSRRHHGPIDSCLEEDQVIPSRRLTRDLR